VIYIAAAFVATRIALALTIVCALAFLVPACQSCVDASTNTFLSGLTRWDATAYVDIARNGYAGQDPSNGAYSPLYPLLIAIGGRLLGGSPDAFVIAGALIANAALLVALVLLERFARSFVDAGAARRAVMYVLVFPSTVFLSAPYAESLFLALAIASALDAERGLWMRSGVLAALAAFTRPFGAIAAIPLAFELWRARAAITAGTWLALAFAPLAFFAWSAYLASLSGDPLQVLHVYRSWGSSPRSPLQAFADLFDPAIYGFPWIVLGLIVLFVALVIASWRIVGPAYGALGTALVLVVTSSGSLTSSMRYELAIYPAFITLAALLRSTALNVAWTAASAILALVLTAMYALWLWIG